MSWDRIPLGEIADFSNGVNFGKTAYSAGVKLISVSNFGDRFSPDYEELQEVSENVVRTGDYLQNGDIVFVRSNGNKELVGRCMLISNPQYPVTYSGFCIRARMKDNCKHNPVFFTYYFKSKAFRKAVSGNAVGANIQNLSQGRLSNHIAYVPDSDTQNKIASVLSSYDALIENNQKQIKLLEEAAQRLYKEWFVDLRFPGHESMPIVDGVPEGWKQGVLNDIVKESGKKISKDKREGYTYYLPIDCLPKKSLGYVETKEIEFAESSLVAFEPGDIIFGAMRPYFHKVVVARDNGITRTTCFVLNANDTVYWAYAVMLMFSADTVDYATQISVGTTMPYTRWKDFKSMTIFIPSKECATAFDRIVRPIITKICSLAKQIALLQQARDRLLPKLMSGEIEV